MIQVKFTADPIPSDFNGSLQDFQDRFLLNLRGTIDEADVVLGQVGGTKPITDVGPWFDGESWHKWNGSDYVPSAVKVASAGYVVQLGDYTTVDATQLLPKTQTLQDKDGVVALLSDIYVGRPCVILTTATPSIDWGLSNHFTETLSANTTVSMKNSKPGQRIVVTLVNPSSYTVAWPSYIFWAGGSAPTQTTTGTDKYEFENVAGSIYGSQGAAYS